MTEKGSTVTLDAEWLLNRLDALDRAIADIRKAASEGIFGKAPARAQPASPSGINLHLLEWKTKGSQPASDDAPWAWAFAYDQEGFVLDAAKQLLEELERHKMIYVDGYEISLSGRDKKLLSRKTLKKER